MKTSNPTLIHTQPFFFLLDTEIDTLELYLNICSFFQSKEISEEQNEKEELEKPPPKESTKSK